MRITQIIQKPQARGAEIFASQLSSELNKMGHELILISLFDGDYSLPFEGNQIHLKLSKKNRFWDLKAWNQLGSIIKEFKPDIVQANGADTLKFSVFSRLTVAADYKLIFNNGGVVSHYIDSFLKRKFNQFLYRHVDALISVTSFSKMDLDRIIAIQKPHHVIPIGLDLGSSFYLNPASPIQVIVHIGGFTPEKNHFAVLRIFEKYLEVNPSSQLWLIGDGPLKKQIEIKVKEASYSNNIRFFGAVFYPFSILPNNALLILPSKVEGLPAVILEAFYHRIPVFAYDVGGVSEVLKNLETGHLIPAGDEDSFLKSMIQYRDIPVNQQIQILQNARKLIIDYHNIQKVTKQFEDYYVSLCELSK